MGFIDEAAGGGGPPIMKFNKEARYAKSGSALWLRKVGLHV